MSKSDFFLSARIGRFSQNGSHLRRAIFDFFGDSLPLWGLPYTPLLSHFDFRSYYAHCLLKFGMLRIVFFYFHCCLGTCDFNILHQEF